MGSLTRRLALALMVIGTSGCQMGYLLDTAYNQIKLLNQRRPISKVLKEADLTTDEKEKLQLSQEARLFAERELGLKETQNYTSYVALNRSAVTYVVAAADKWQLKPYLWGFPIIGEVPYKGYFNEEDAKAEQERLDKEGYDTFYRGVSAYSTLGYFNDPITTPMLRYEPHELVNTVIHETVHATMYFKSNADFNERIAVFLGNKGTELFYRAKEGDQGPTLALIRNENEDDKLFSRFITAELKELELWYQKNIHQNEELRQARLKELTEKYKASVAPLMKSTSYQKFAERKLNNARLLIYKTYVSDLEDFEVMFNKLGKDFKRFIETAKSFERAKDPDQAVKDWNNSN